MSTFTLSLTALLSISLLTKASEPVQPSRTSFTGFKENKGQVSDQFCKARPDILFSGEHKGMSFHLKNNGISYQLSRVDTWRKWERHAFEHLKRSEAVMIPEQITCYRLDVNWLNTGNTAQIETKEAFGGYENFYLTSCPEGALHVQSYKQLVYKSIYPGIDLKWYEKSGDLKYDYYVAPNTDYKQIRLEYKGAEKIYVAGTGELVIETPLGTLKEQEPLVIQNNTFLKARWLVENNIVSFDIKNADPALPLIIDPMIRLWGSYYGGSGADDAYYIESDPFGNIYVSGSTSSSANIATSGAHQAIIAGGPNNKDGYLAKFNSLGARLWATYYGGSGDDYCSESNIDANGNVVITGGTNSSNPGVIATPGAHQTIYNGNTTSTTANTGDAFLLKLNAAGIRQWGTYYGGEGWDWGDGLSLDYANNIYIIGSSQSTVGISTPGSHNPNLSTTMDAFLAKFDANGVRQWGTYYAGKGNGSDCVNDASGNIYISGVTSHSLGVSTPGSHQPTYSGGSSQNSDAFFAKFDSNGALLWGTYYGGTGSDGAWNLSIDGSGNIYGCGRCSNASNGVFNTPGCHQPVFGGGINDGFLVKFDPSGVRLWGTYYGGPGNDAIWATALDAYGDIFASGQTGTTSVTGTAIATSCAYQDKFGGGSDDIFMAKFTNAGARIWSSYYGSIYTDGGADCTYDPSGNIYICGITLANSGTVMASANSHQPVHGGGASDGFIAKFDGCIPGNLPPVSLCASNSATLSASCGDWYSSPSSTVILNPSGSFTTAPLTADTTFYIDDLSCGTISGARTAVHVSVIPTPTLSVTNSNPMVCAGEKVLLTASGAHNYTWSPMPANTFTYSALILAPTTFSVAGDKDGCSGTTTITIIPQQCLGIESHAAASSLIVYPNPGHERFHIRAGREMQLILSNELGQQLRSILLSADTNFSAEILNLPDGVYFLSSQDESRTINRKLIVLK